MRCSPRNLGLGRLVARPVYYPVPLVRLADVKVHQYPRHRELGEGVDVGPTDRSNDLEIQERGERRQDRQAEVEGEEEDRSRYDERLLSLHELLNALVRSMRFHSSSLVTKAPFSADSLTYWI
jgi:hypothetical protein